VNTHLFSLVIFYTLSLLSPKTLMAVSYGFWCFKRTWRRKMSVSLPRPLKIGRWMRLCLYAGTYINTHISFHRSLSTQLSPLLSKNRQSLATWLFVPPKIARQRSHVFLSPVSSQMTERLVTYLFELKTSKSLMHVFLEDVETSYLDHQLPTKPPSPSHPLFSTHLSSL
jgi:hypothetical protein